MPKMKTKKAAAKRMSLTGSGKVKYKKMNLRHILTKKATMIGSIVAAAVVFVLLLAFCVRPVSVGYTYNHICKAFKKYYGFSPKNYLLKKKMEYASLL